jgi:hypothetical protein
MGRIGRILLLAGFVFWILETWYFGFNRSPESDAELACDIFATAAMLIGAMLGFRIKIEVKRSE